MAAEAIPIERARSNPENGLKAVYTAESSTIADYLLIALSWATIAAIATDSVISKIAGIL